MISSGKYAIGTKSTNADRNNMNIACHDFHVGLEELEKARVIDTPSVEAQCLAISRPRKAISSPYSESHWLSKFESVSGVRDLRKTRKFRSISPLFMRDHTIESARKLTFSKPSAPCSFAQCRPNETSLRGTRFCRDPCDLSRSRSLVYDTGTL
jgi:hypothetical protein